MKSATATGKKAVAVAVASIGDDGDRFSYPQTKKISNTSNCAISAVKELKKKVNWRHIRRETSGSINPRVRTQGWLGSVVDLTEGKRYKQAAHWPPHFTLRRARSVHACSPSLWNGTDGMTKSAQSPTPNDSKRRSALMAQWPYYTNCSPCLLGL